MVTGDTSINCRWNWCRSVSAFREDLIRHVQTIHVANAKFVKRKDIPMLKRTEQGSQATTTTDISGIGASSRGHFTQASTFSQKSAQPSQASRSNGLSLTINTQASRVSQAEPSHPSPTKSDSPVEELSYPETSPPISPTAPDQQSQAQAPLAVHSQIFNTASQQLEKHAGSINGSPLKRKGPASPSTLPANKKRKRPFNNQGISQSLTSHSQDSSALDSSVPQKEVSPPLFIDQSPSPPSQAVEEPPPRRSTRQRSNTPRPDREPSRRTPTQRPDSQRGSRTGSRGVSRTTSQSPSQSQSHTPSKPLPRSKSGTPASQHSATFFGAVSNKLKSTIWGRTSPIPEEPQEDESQPVESLEPSLKTQIMTQAPFKFGYSSQSQSQSQSQ